MNANEIQKKILIEKLFVTDLVTNSSSKLGKKLNVTHFTYTPSAIRVNLKVNMSNYKWSSTNLK